MNDRFLFRPCVRQGITPDLGRLADALLSWSALLDLSDRSVRDGSIPVRLSRLHPRRLEDPRGLRIVS
jgi:hypothetical protein